jgi:hypothetical protein
MSDTPRTQAAVARAVVLIHRGFDDSNVLQEMAEESRAIERELVFAKQIIADAIKFEEEFEDMFPDAELLKILKRPYNPERK